MAEHFYILRHPDYKEVGGERVISERGRRQYTDLASRVKAEIDGRSPTILSSPARRAFDGAEVLKQYLGGTIEPLPILWTGKDAYGSYRYSTQTPDIVSRLNQQEKVRLFGEEWERLQAEISSLLVLEIRDWIADNNIMPQIGNIPVPFGRSSSHFIQKNDNLKIVGLDVAVPLGFDETEEKRPYMAALLKDRLRNPPLIMIGHLELVSYLYRDLFTDLGIPSEAYRELDFNEREHHGYHITNITMPAENPQSWEIGLVPKE